MNTLTVSLVAIMIPGVIMALIYDTYTQHKPCDSFRYIHWKYCLAVCWLFHSGLLLS